MSERARRLLERYGSETVSFQALEPGLDYWFSDDGDAFVAYTDTGKAWVAAGAPVCARERRGEIVRAFAEAARAAGRRPRFFAIEEEPAEDTGFHSVLIGEQPFWNPARWPEHLREKRSLREQLRRARAKGVRVRAVDPAELAPGRPDRARLDRLLRRWQESRDMAPMGFLVTLDVLGHADERIHLFAELHGELVGLLVAVPIYAADGWFFEDVLRDPGAPNGTVELLFDHAMRLAAERDARVVTFGLAPLAGVPSPILRGIRRSSRWLYDFAGLRAFKAKLLPDRWRPVYLAHPKGERGVRAIADSLRAFAGGSLLRFGARTLVHRAPDLTWLLAALLVPWTALLIAAPTERWFPSQGVQAAWVFFDALLFSGLVALARRWQRGLAQLLAAGAAADFALGLGQALTFNAGRARGPLDLGAIAVALAAPLGASLFLGAASRRDRLYIGAETSESRGDPAAARSSAHDD